MPTHAMKRFQHKLGKTSTKKLVDISREPQPEPEPEPEPQVTHYDDLAETLATMTVKQILDAVEAGEYDATRVYEAEMTGRRRSSLLNNLLD